MKRPICHWMVLAALSASFLVCQAVLAEEQYIIKRGDTLARISKKFHASIQELRDANQLRGNTLRPGEALLIPAGARTNKAQSVSTATSGSAATLTESYTVKRGDTLYSIARETGVPVDKIKRLNHLRGSRLQIGQNLVLPEARTEQEISGWEERVVTSSGETNDAWDGEEGLIDDQVGEEDPGATVADRSTGTDILGKWNSIMERQLLVKVAKGFIGAPYRLGGSSVRGIDCSGFVQKIYDMFNIILPRTARDQSCVGRSVSRGELEEGDLVFFQDRRSIAHVGIYVGNNQFVHAASGGQRRVCISSLSEPYYSKRYVKATRLKGLDQGV